MPPGFVTQLVTDRPQVILITLPGDMSQLRAELDKQGLEVIEVSTAAFLSSEFGFSDNLYKVVWVCSPSLSQSTLRAISQKLQVVRDQTTIVFLATTPTRDSSSLVSSWTNSSQQQMDVIKQLKKNLPTVPIILAQDIVTTTFPQPILQVMTSLTSSSVVLDPQIEFYPQPWSSFWQKVARLFIKPGLTSMVVRGKKITTSSLAKVLQLHIQRQTGDLPTIEALSASSYSLLSDTKKLDNFTAFSLDDLAALVASQVKPKGVKTETKPEVPPPSRVAASPTFPVVSPSPDFPTGVVKRIPPKSSPMIRSSLEETKSAVKTTNISPLKSPFRSHETAKPSYEKKPETKQSVENVSKKMTSDLGTPSEMKQESLDDEVTRLFKSYRSDQKVERVKHIARTTVTTTKKNTRKGLLFKGGAISLVLACLVIVLTFGYFFSTRSLKQQLVQTLTKPADSSLVSPLMMRAVKLQIGVYSLVFDTSFFGANLQMVRIAEHLPEIQKKQSELTRLTETAYQQIVGRQTGKVFETTSQAVVVAQSLYELLAQNQAAIKELDISTDDQTQSQIQAYTEALNRQKKALLPMQQLHSLLPQLLGQEGKRTYAVLLQNHQELRPTGGFIQAVALLTFDQGVWVDTQVFSPYELDEQLAGVVQPPDDLAQLLGEQQWYFRDSNWQPDFPTAAEQMIWFLERTTNHQVDGVIGLNSFVLRDMLRVVGPLELPEYNELITDRNIFERLEFHSELQLPENQNQPDYSTLLLSRLLQKMTNMSPDKSPGLIEVLGKNLEDKQLLVSLKDSAELLTFTNLGWSGALLQPACPAQLETDNCMVDTVALVESNVGINKANAYVERTINHQVELSETVAEHTRLITYTNTATSNAWPKGTYKNYLRLYVSPTAQLQEVLINGTPLPSSQIVQRTENEKQLFGFLVEVPIKQKVEVQIRYAVPASLKPQAAYTLFNQQQPGIQTPPLTIEVHYPTDWQPAVIAPQAEVRGNSVHFEQLALPHSFVGVVFK